MTAIFTPDVIFIMCRYTVRWPKDVFDFMLTATKPAFAATDTITTTTATMYR